MAQDQIDWQEILRSLGRLEQGLSSLREDVQTDKAHAVQSRRVMYDKQEDLTEDMAKLRESLVVSAHVNAQVREEVKALKGSLDAFKKEVEPSIKDFERLKTMGKGIGTFLAMGGLGVGLIVVSGIEWAKNLLRSWL